MERAASRAGDWPELRDSEAPLLAPKKARGVTAESGATPTAAEAASNGDEAALLVLE
jgi:hypothetical protein